MKNVTLALLALCAGCATAPTPKLAPDPPRRIAAPSSAPGQMTFDESEVDALCAHTLVCVTGIKHPHEGHCPEEYELGLVPDPRPVRSLYEQRAALDNILTLAVRVLEHAGHVTPEHEKWAMRALQLADARLVQVRRDIAAHPQTAGVAVDTSNTPPPTTSKASALARALGTTLAPPTSPPRKTSRR